MSGFLFAGNQVQRVSAELRLEAAELEEPGFLLKEPCAGADGWHENLAYLSRVAAGTTLGSCSYLPGNHMALALAKLFPLLCSTAGACPAGLSHWVCSVPLALQFLLFKLFL